MKEKELLNFCFELPADSKIQVGDWIEWDLDAFTTVANRSMLTYKMVAELPSVHNEAYTFKRAAKAYRKKTV